MVKVKVDDELEELLKDYIRRKEKLPPDTPVKIKYVDIDVKIE